MRKGVIVLVGVCAAAVLVLFVTGLTEHERRAFTIGVAVGGVAATLEPGQEACQQPITVPDGDAGFERVSFTLGTFGRPGPAVDVSVHGPGDRVLGRGTLAAGYPDITAAPTHTVAVGHVDARGPLAVCLRNAGTRKVAVYGNGNAASRTSTAFVAGQPVDTDLSLVFERAEPRSALSLLPAFFERASLWRAGWVGAWTYWLFAAVALILVPALLVVALRTAQEP
jgi:hypothetical protein